MRRTAFGLLSLAAPIVLGAFATTACEDAADNPLTQGAEALCGPCGDLSTGEISVSANARLDGFFAAVSTLNKATVSINADFEANIDSLIATFGVTGLAANASLDAKVTALLAKIDAEITANADGGISLKYEPPRCQASVEVAFEAQAQCEAKAECDVQATPPSIAVECQGQCEGSCDAQCEGELKCDVTAGAECEGKCEGTCEMEAGATCEGTCHGECEGTCSVQNADGSCAGECEGTCSGSCELKASATCEGTCSGKCVVSAGAMCDGKPPSCSGKCSGKCEGSCTGNATPPSASANCDASAECKAQAKAQGSASLECSPPSLELAYAFDAGVSASARASFVTRMTELRVRGAAIIEGFTKYNLLLTGKATANGAVIINPSPVAQVQTAITGFASADASAEFGDIPPGRLPCLIPAFATAGTMLAGMVSESSANLAAQGKFAVALTTGDFG
jgi:hypothetical protein